MSCPIVRSSNGLFPFMCLSFWIRGNMVTKLHSLKKDHKPACGLVFPVLRNYQFQWGLVEWSWDQCWSQQIREVGAAVLSFGFLCQCFMDLCQIALVQPEVEDSSTFVRVSSSLFSWALSPILVNYVLYLVRQCKETLLKRHLIWEERDKGLLFLEGTLKELSSDLCKNSRNLFNFTRLDFLQHRIPHKRIWIRKIT